MAIGYICGKKKLLTGESLAGISSLTVYIFLPAMLAYNIGKTELSSSELKDFLVMLLLSGLSLIVNMVFSYFWYKFRKIDAEDKKTLEFSSFINNNGFIGFPMALAFFGEQGVFYMVPTNITLGVGIWTYGVILMNRGKKGASFSFKALLTGILKLILNPNIIATILGLILCFGHIELPGALADILSGLGSIATPLAMIYLGASLASCNFLDLLKDKLALDSSLVRIVIAPAITLAAVYFLNITPIMKNILMLEMILPVAASMPMIIKALGGRDVLCARVVFLSTIISIVTMPLWLTLQEYLF
jgi:predicted permease